MKKFVDLIGQLHTVQFLLIWTHGTRHLQDYQIFFYYQAVPILTKVLAGNCFVIVFKECLLVSYFQMIIQKLGIFNYYRPHYGFFFFLKHIAVNHFYNTMSICTNLESFSVWYLKRSFTLSLDAINNCNWSFCFLYIIIIIIYYFTLILVLESL